MTPTFLRNAAKRYMEARQWQADRYVRAVLQGRGISTGFLDEADAENKRR